MTILQDLLLLCFHHDNELTMCSCKFLLAVVKSGEDILEGYGSAPHEQHVYLPYFNGTTLLTSKLTELHQIMRHVFFFYFPFAS